MVLKNLREKLTGRSARGPGFALAEVLVGMGVVVLTVLACLLAITFSRVSSVKAKDQAIALDFIIHYLETIRGLEFDAVRPGAAINPLLDGQDGAPNIRIPAQAGFSALNTADYTIFQPELAWFTGRDLEMNVVYSSSLAGGVVRSKHLQVVLRWEPPLGRGPSQTVRFDMVRVREL